MLKELKIKLSPFHSKRLFVVPAYPQSISEKGFGDTPLQIAIKNNSSVDTIKCLIEGDSSVVKIVDDNGTTPLHQAIEFQCPVEVISVLISNHSDIVLATNKIGNTPVHIAIKHRIRPYEVVKELVYKCPQVVHCCNNSGESPLDLIYTRFRKCTLRDSIWRTLVLLLRIYENEPCQQSTSDLKDTDHEEYQAKASSNEDGVNNLSILHPMLQTAVPYEIVEFTLKRHAKAMQNFDEKSRCLPIFHLAKNNTKDRERILSLMLSTYPRCANIEDGEKDLLLVKMAMHAIISAKLFSDIVAANPNALETTDSRFGLYPFMLAAIMKDKELNADGSHSFSRQFGVWGFVLNQDRLQLDAVYFLMREKPELVELACINRN